MDALATASPGKFNCASTSVGSYLHVTSEWFQKMAGIRFNHIPYGSGHWQTALRAGTVDAVMYPLLMADHVRSGKLRALGVANAGRAPMLPEVPTFADAGYPEYRARAWAGLVVPGGTPAPVIERLARACACAAQRPEFREFATRHGAAAVGSSPAGFDRYLRTERAQLMALIAKNHIRVDCAMLHPHGRIGHVALCVRSLAVSMPFYTQVLSLREVARLDAQASAIVGGNRAFLVFGSNHHDLALLEAPRDHEVSQSLYLRGPDGLLIALFVDGDPAPWAARPQAVATVRPLQVDWLG